MDGGDVIAPLVRVVIPGAPKAWQRAGHRIATNKAGKQFVTSYTPSQTRSEQGAIRMFASAAMQGQPPLEGPLDLRISAFMPVPQSWSQRKQAQALAGVVMPTGKPDWDNLAKSVCDALSKVVFRDDSQVVNAAVWKRYAADPRVVIEVRKA